MTEILDKTREWSERFSGILRASAETQYPHLYKGAVGGLEHVISVDNGGSYMEMWRDGGDQYYATTGAAIKPLPGLAKGARLDEALDRFFVLMAKVEKTRDARPARDDGKRPARGQRKAIPKKLKRLAGVRKQGQAAKPHGHPHSEAHTHGKAGGGYAGGSQSPGPRSPIHSHPVRKNIVEKVDPEIGPSMSVGHRKPSDLSPESSMRKMARLIVNNVVALTGNQPGSGRVKPPKPKPKSDYKSPQGFSGRRMGTPGTPGASHSGMVQQDAMGRKTSSRRSQPDFGRLETKHEDKHGSTAHHKRGGGGGRKPARQLSVPEKHQLRIARQNAELNPAMQGVMGGPSIEESKEIIERLTGQPYKQPKVSPWTGKPYGKPPYAERKTDSARFAPSPADPKRGELPKRPSAAERHAGRAPGSTAKPPKGWGTSRFNPANKPGRKQSKENLRRPGVSTMAGGRTQPGGGTKPMKPAMGGRGQPKSYGSTGQPQYSYGRKARRDPSGAYRPETTRVVSAPEKVTGDQPDRPKKFTMGPTPPERRAGQYPPPAAKACLCDEVAKAVRAAEAR